MSKQISEFDQNLLNKICACEKVSFGSLCTIYGLRRGEAKAIDKALQTLRRKGFIRYEKKGNFWCQAQANTP